MFFLSSPKWSKIRFQRNSLVWRRRKRFFPVSYGTKFAATILDSLGCTTVKPHGLTFISFDTIPACDRQTDRQTDIQYSNQGAELSWWLFTCDKQTVVEPSDPDAGHFVCVQSGYDYWSKSIICRRWRRRHYDFIHLSVALSSTARQRMVHFL